MKRRNFLIGTAVAAGGLAIGYRVWTNSFEAQAAALVTGDGGSLLGGWVKIAPDDTVTVYVPHIDMGQGTHTALAMMLAEELDADWSRVRTERAPSEKAFANRFLAEGWILQGWRLPAFLDGAVDTAFGEAARFANLQITGGSTAVRFTGQVGLRIVGAAARSMLIEAAARRWQVSARELAAADSVVSHAASGRTARYGELAAGRPSSAYRRARASSSARTTRSSAGRCHGSTSRPRSRAGCSTASTFSCPGCSTRRSRRHLSMAASSPPSIPRRR